jgi:hypothetical protein
VIIEKIKIIVIETRFISLGNLSKKYMSCGNISILNIFDKKNLISSTFIENNTPKIIPQIVAVRPIVKPVKKKIL